MIYRCNHWEQREVGVFKCDRPAVQVFEDVQRKVREGRCADHSFTHHESPWILVEGSLREVK